jgi:hypothetical protein
MDCPTFIETYKTEEHELCDRIIARLEELLSDAEQSHHYMDGTEMHGSAVERKDYSFNFKSIKDPLAVDMHNVLGRCVKEYGLKYPGFASQGCMSDDMKVQKTPPKGGFHTWHCEQGSQNNSSFRNLTWTFYLNDLPEGEGETEFLEYGVKVSPKKADLCLFPAAWTHTHRGNPVYTHDKYIATGWYYLV